MKNNRKPYTAEFTVNYGGGESTILEKHFDEFSEALQACRKFRKYAGVEFAGSVIRENEWAEVLHEITAQGTEHFTAYRDRDDYGEIILAARGNSKNLTRI